jgi:hypothetical protein
MRPLIGPGDSEPRSQQQGSSPKWQRSVRRVTRCAQGRAASLSKKVRHAVPSFTALALAVPGALSSPPAPGAAKSLGQEQHG